MSFLSAFIFIYNGSVLSVPSVYSVTKNRDFAMHSIRISLSYLTTKDEIFDFLIAFDECYKKYVY